MGVWVYNLKDIRRQKWCVENIGVVMSSWKAEVAVVKGVEVCSPSVELADIYTFCAHGGWKMFASFCCAKPG